MTLRPVRGVLAIAALGILGARARAEPAPSLANLSREAQCAVTAARARPCAAEMLAAEEHELGFDGIGGPKGPWSDRDAAAQHRIRCRASEVYPAAIVACWSEPTCDAFARCVSKADKPPPSMPARTATPPRASPRAEGPTLGCARSARVGQMTMSFNATGRGRLSSFAFDWDLHGGILVGRFVGSARTATRSISTREARRLVEQLATRGSPRDCTGPDLEVRIRWVCDDGPEVEHTLRSDSCAAGVVGGVGLPDLDAYYLSEIATKSISKTR